MTRILVTGATGFLGRHVIDALLDPASSSDRQHSIRILTRSDHRWEGDPRIECVVGDVTDSRAVRQAMSGVDVVLHLAGIVRRDPASADRMHETHVVGTRHICEAAREEGKLRIVVASSSGTIAVSRDPVVHTESSPYAIKVAEHWPYYISKIEQEKLALSYDASGELDIVILNPSILLGPGDTNRSSTNDVRAFLDRKIPNVPTGGFNFVDARDAARAFVSAIDRGESGRRYLIGGHNITVREFFQLLEQVSGIRAPTLTLPEWLARSSAGVGRFAMRLIGSKFPIDDVSIEMAYRFWYCDSTLAAGELSFEPRSAEETIRDTVRFIRDETSALEQ